MIFCLHWCGDVVKLFDMFHTHFIHVQRHEWWHFITAKSVWPWQWVLLTLISIKGSMWPHVLHVKLQAAVEQPELLTSVQWLAWRERLITWALKLTGHWSHAARYSAWLNTSIKCKMCMHFVTVTHKEGSCTRSLRLIPLRSSVWLWKQLSLTATQTERADTCFKRTPDDQNYR